MLLPSCLRPYLVEDRQRVMDILAWDALLKVTSQSAANPTCVYGLLPELPGTPGNCLLQLQIPFFCFAC